MWIGIQQGSEENPLSFDLLGVGLGALGTISPSLNMTYCLATLCEASELIVTS